MRQATLSVIMCNYNHAHYIAAQIEAILNQSFQPIEFIIVDDGSTDNSLEVIHEFTEDCPIIHLVCNETNRGVIYSGNRALEMASGDYIFWPAADDLVLPGLFEKSMDLLARFPNAGLCCSDPMFFNSEGSFVDRNALLIGEQPCYFSPDEVVKLIRLRGVFMAGFTSIVKRSALLEMGEYIPEVQWYSDWFVSLVVGLRHGICYIPEALASFRVQLNSYSSASKRWYLQREVISSILTLLRSDDYADIWLKVQDSKVIPQFGVQLLRLALHSSKHRYVLSMLSISDWLWLLWYDTKKIAARFLPLGLRQVYRSLTRYSH